MKRDKNGNIIRKIGDVMEFKHNGQEYRFVLGLRGWKKEKGPIERVRRSHIRLVGVRDFSKMRMRTFRVPTDNLLNQIINRRAKPKKDYDVPIDFNPLGEMDRAISLYIAREQLEVSLSQERYQLELLHDLLLKAGDLIANLEPTTLEKLNLDLSISESISEEWFKLGRNAGIICKELPLRIKKPDTSFHELIRDLREVYEKLTGKKATYGAYLLAKGKSEQISEFMTFIMPILRIIANDKIKKGKKPKRNPISKSGFSSKVRTALSN